MGRAPPRKLWPKANAQLAVLVVALQEAFEQRPRAGRHALVDQGVRLVVAARRSLEVDVDPARLADEQVTRADVPLQYDRQGRPQRVAQCAGFAPILRRDLT